MSDLSVDLTGKVAVVSGGSSGMGAAICKRFASSGATVVVGGRDPERTDAVVAGLNAAGATAMAWLGDVSDSAVADGMIAAAVQTCGGVDIVVNAAGVIHRTDAPG
ncbi:MAG: SDR family NAD(P)-dependent oxidoreductase, partial [Acidimicrobiaceae bacterium]|nr:SDR family NAD(P)-dependent oxidoreductase [Acidimicrobiaceae bacterium]